MIELLDCPFCGGKAVLTLGTQQADGTWTNGTCGCKQCGVYFTSKDLFEYTGTIYHGFVSDEVAKKCSETAAEAWNTRAERTATMNPKHPNNCPDCGAFIDENRRFKNYCPKCGVRLVEQ